MRSEKHEEREKMRTPPAKKTVQATAGQVQGLETVRTPRDSELDVPLKIYD